MGSSITQLVLYVLGGVVLGAVSGWIAHVVRSKRRFDQLTNGIRTQLREVTAHRNKLAGKYSRSKSAIDELQAANARLGTEHKTLREQSKLLARSVRTLKTERENTKRKLSTIQNALISLRQQRSALRQEFDKTHEFYRRELLKSLQKRKDLEKDITIARAEQESFAKAVESSVLEHGSEENMVIAAQLRLGQIEVLERTINKLEAENAQLANDAKQLKHDFEARDRDRAELEELKVHNKQLVACVEALEDSRKEYEADAERYRQQAGDSEKLSDTLRLKLDDLEKNFADMEKEQNEAIEEARNAAVVPILRKQG